MSESKFKLAVVIGRFQPVHAGHVSILKEAMKIAENIVVLVGSSYCARDIQNPWTFDERRIMLSNVFNDAVAELAATCPMVSTPNLVIKPIQDSLYNDSKWLLDVQSAISEAYAETIGGTSIGADDVVIVGHMKDHTSEYLKWFPQFHTHNVTLCGNIHATEVRKVLFSDADTSCTIDVVSASLPNYATKYLRAFAQTSVFSQLVAEAAYHERYKAQWSKSPYPPTFVTTDVVAECKGHVLLVRRRTEPGKGLWALPGGFIGQHETLVDSALRELREETQLRCLNATLKTYIREVRVFDGPRRSLRGRTITHAYHIVLPFGELPEVKGADDAETATWVPISEIVQRDMVESMFEDHAEIIRCLLGL